MGKKGKKNTTILLFLITPLFIQARITLRSTTCLWSSQHFGLHFTTVCHTRKTLSPLEKVDGEQKGGAHLPSPLRGGVGVG